MKKAFLMILLFLLGAVSFSSFASSEGAVVPVLMYHHFIEKGPSSAYTVVSAPRFQEQLNALSKAGYTAVTPQQLIDYVHHNGKLPKKPVLITMDDGYTSNLELAAPILSKQGMTGTVFVIGINVGETLYPHSGLPLDPPRFSFEQVKPWVDDGVLVVQSHTYDMHQRTSYGFSGRDGVLPLPGETDEQYREALRDDFSRAAQQLKDGLDRPMEVLAFPFGLRSPQAVEELKAMGVQLTLTTDTGANRIYPGQPDSLHQLRRCNVTDALTGPQLVDWLARLEKKV